MFKQNNSAITKWLIQWVGSSPEDATWEPATEIMLRYPTFQHEVDSSTAAMLKGAGDDEIPIIGPAH